MNKPTKGEVKEAVRKHQETLRSLLQSMMTNDGSRVAAALEKCSSSYDEIVDVLEKRYPDSFGSDEDPDDEEEEEEEDDEEEDEEEVELEEEDD
jgi:hypothetical protein